VNQSKYNSTSPENLLSPEQAQNLKQNFNSVQKDLKDYSKKLSADSGDVDAAKQALSDLGARGGDISNLIQDIQSAKEAEGWLKAAETLGKVGKDALPVLAAIGLSV
jgi:uncharacterized protein involved in exopolysaccharide biosynthesis